MWQQFRWRSVLGSFCIAVGAAAGPVSAQTAGNAPPAGAPPASSEAGQAADAQVVTCTRKIESFVRELDDLLASDPMSLDSVQSLLNTYFPLKGCRVDRVLEVCRQSKYFLEIDEWPKEYVVVFDSIGLAKIGYHVSFGLMKESGESMLPGVVNKLPPPHRR